MKQVTFEEIKTVSEAFDNARSAFFNNTDNTKRADLQAKFHEALANVEALRERNNGKPLYGFYNG